MVFVAAFAKRKLICPSRSSNHLANADAGDDRRPPRRDGGFRHAEKFRSVINPFAREVHCLATYSGGGCRPLRFLDKACVRVAQQSGGGATPESPWELCMAADVRQAKTLLAVAPIFACTIVFNTVLAQLQTFSVQQGGAMDTALPGFGGFRVPPASLQAIPYAVMLALVPAYELLLVPLSRRLAAVVTPLRRVGMGLFTVAFSMVAAAAVERRRRRAALGGERISVLWIAPQFVVFGVSEMFTAVGLVEFLYEQAAVGSRAFMTALTYCSYALGFFLSSVLVSLVNSATAGGGAGAWLGDNDLDKDRLDLFYWMLAVLSAVNFCCFLLCARWYSSGEEAAHSAAAAEVAAEGNVMEIIT
ncbi:hypothetical protein E2562_008690 [Oryza meyeriana var. granulata]|uniref:Major facilitator superfamily (MFS) profile domain-containing protein n=1 Tax=Oryza meyeriana var. granulata TaxID=110450 RepID=A0A6G1F5P6_9ORYZ|nr:hypothetical protein E2562_008690 [Oryza meyeriana var. granulata]